MTCKNLAVAAQPKSRDPPPRPAHAHTARQPAEAGPSAKGARSTATAQLAHVAYRKGSQRNVAQSGKSATTGQQGRLQQACLEEERHRQVVDGLLRERVHQAQLRFAPLQGAAVQGLRLG
eukprot:2620174-Prymnesium_polylepis.1